MKRRNFISSSMMGASGIILGPELGMTSESKKNLKTTVRIPDLAPAPPLGWNSFNSYGVYLHHDAAMANIKAMAEKLKPHGYEYFVIDGGWYGEFKLIPGTLFPTEKHAESLNFNEYGILQPSKTYFPQGFKPIVDYAHMLGLKTGLHLMRGICRKAVEMNLPVKNSKYRAADVADKNSICVWNSQNYGIDPTKPGAQDWYDSVYSQVAEWGFDFVKVDDLVPYPHEIALIANAIEKTGRPMIFSLSPGGVDYLPDMPFYRRANMLRVSGDIWDRQKDIDEGFRTWKKYQGMAYKGFWIDLDMIPFGKLQLMSPEQPAGNENTVRLAGFGTTRMSQLSPAQMRTFITMRSLAASPLFMGGDLPTLDDYSLSLLTNPDMLECNQNGECGFNIYEQNGIEVWTVRKKTTPMEGWTGIFNRTGSSSEINLTRKELGLARFLNGTRQVAYEGQIELKDVWKNVTFNAGENLVKTIDMNDVLFLKYKILA